MNIFGPTARSLVREAFAAAGVKPPILPRLLVEAARLAVQVDARYDEVPGRCAARGTPTFEDAANGARAWSDEHQRIYVEEHQAAEAFERERVEALTRIVLAEQAKGFPA